MRHGRPTRALTGLINELRVTQNAVKISKSKWQWVGYIALRIHNQRGRKVPEWRSRTGRRGVWRPPIRWNEDDEVVSPPLKLSICCWLGVAQYLAS
ncbi:hypothetical protein EVAR_69229_1 [Eumeta japonica]|uniref:Uncharacterized protein n=1 Tax=Eumeta variegata TaxID=151549 RepID=A0A4C1SPN3_EUMVA|nr:hypothetical protein EVAR_69229_1 [Eumeta japonica]